MSLTKEAILVGLASLHKVTPIEEEGLPDLKVEFPKVTYPTFFECGISELERRDGYFEKLLYAN